MDIVSTNYPAIISTCGLALDMDIYAQSITASDDNGDNEVGKCDDSIERSTKKRKIDITGSDSKSRLNEKLLNMWDRKHRRDKSPMVRRVIFIHYDCSN